MQLDGDPALVPESRQMMVVAPVGIVGIGLFVPLCDQQVVPLLDPIEGEQEVHIVGDPGVEIGEFGSERAAGNPLDQDHRDTGRSEEPEGRQGFLLDPQSPHRRREGLGLELLPESGGKGLVDPERPEPAEQPDSGTLVGYQRKQIGNPRPGPLPAQRRGRVLAEPQRVEQGPDQCPGQEGSLNEEGNAVSTR